MTIRDLEDDFGDPDRSPRADLLARLAHLFPYALGLWVIYMIIHAAGLLPTYGWVAGLAVILVMVIGDLHAEWGRICLRCMEAVPADAGLRVARWRWLLWFQHRVMRRWWGYLVGYIVIVTAEVVFRLLLGFESGQAQWTGTPMDIWVMLAIWSGWKHHRYRPWCPYCCDWGSGGPRERVPDPDVRGVKT